MLKMVLVHCMYLYIQIFIFIFYVYRIQTEGLGGLRPNTIVLCWPLHWKKDFDSYTADAFVRKEKFLFFY